MGNDQTPIHPAWLSSTTIQNFTIHSLCLSCPTTSKYCYPCLWLSHSPILKLYHPSTWNFFGLLIPLSFFLNCIYCYQWYYCVMITHCYCLWMCYAYEPLVSARLLEVPSSSSLPPTRFLPGPLLLYNKDFVIILLLW